MNTILPFPALFGLGLIFGSFLGSVTWRLPHGLSILSTGSTALRSQCPRCRKSISWYDNIPLLSYVVLKRKCRFCKRAISVRYPIIELVTALLFTFLGFMYTSREGLALVYWKQWLGELTLPFFLLASIILLAIFVIDFEHQIIPDALVFWLIVVVFFFLLPSPSPIVFVHVFWASIGALFILFLHAITRGKGMGLGDVKLMAGLGLLAGPATPLLFLVAVFVGAVVGVGLIFLKKARFGKPIPFGPFLVFASLIVLLFEDRILGSLFL